MKKILILFAHPRLEQSRVHRELLKALPTSPYITFRDLYELYPDFNIDIEGEKKLLLDHDIIIWQHPLYWYSAPPLLKQWIDMVLEFGWAYGPGGTALQGKWVFNIISSGGTREVYQQGGRNRYTIAEFLRPFEQTALLCGMEWLPPFAIQGTHKLDNAGLKNFASQYGRLLELLVSGEPIAPQSAKIPYLNDYLDTLTPVKP